MTRKELIEDLQVGDRVVLEYAIEFQPARIVEITECREFMTFDKGYTITLPVSHIVAKLPAKKGWFS